MKYPVTQWTRLLLGILNVSVNQFPSEDSHYQIQYNTTTSTPLNFHSSPGRAISSERQTMYYQTEAPPLQPLQYHLYSTPLPHTSNLPNHQRTIHSFFMSDNLRENLQRKNESINQTLDQHTMDTYRVPQEVNGYYSLYPLENHSKSVVSKVYGYATSMYKAISSKDGLPYALRRVEGYRLSVESAISSIETWRRIKHANIVNVNEAFTTKAFGDNSLVLVYDYHPLSTTILSTHFPKSNNPPVSENVLWSYISQITSAIKTVHAVNLALNCFEPSKILLTSKNRLRFNGCGLLDIINFGNSSHVTNHQQEDLLHFGQLLVVLATGTLAAVHHLAQSVEFISKNYSTDLKNIVMYLLSKPTSFKSIDDVIIMIGPRLLNEINSSQFHSDFLEEELRKEVENGRLVRLLSKLGHINERPEFDMDPSWSETGDRYLLKLFRDYVFHQVDEVGNPIIDLGHVIETLNKVDVGVDEKIMLISRDEQSCLIVSYRELKQCIDKTFRELSKSK